MKDPIWRLATASCLAATFTSLFGVGTVMAQEVEEIVVSGRSLEETVPLDLARYGNRIEIVTAEEIERQGFDDIDRVKVLAIKLTFDDAHARRLSFWPPAGYYPRSAAEVNNRSAVRAADLQNMVGGVWRFCKVKNG